MSEPLTLLPFFFRENKQSGSIFLSNQLGAFTHLKDRCELSALVEEDYSVFSEAKRSELLAKSFLGEPGETQIRGNIIASNVASRWQEAMRNPSLFMVVPTLRCDHNCRYCQVSRVPLHKAGHDLNPSLIPRILAIIARSRSKQMKIEFQGGEPLVAFDFIKTFVAQAEKALSEKALEFVICSALGPLSDEVVTWALDHNVTFSVSLDGPEMIHNSNRPSDYFNPYQNTAQKIKHIQEKLGAHRIGCLSTTSRQSLSAAKEIVETYFGLGLSSLFVRPISPFGFASKVRSDLYYTADEYFDFYRKCLGRVIELNRERLFIEETAVIHLRRIFSPFTCDYVDLQTPAGYVFGAMVFNYDGNVFGSDEARMLWKMTGNKELVVGNLNQAENQEFLAADHIVNLLSDTFIACNPGCDECAYQPYCGSDPLHHLATQGNHIGNKAISFFCKLQRKIYDHLFDLLENNPEANRVFTSWLKH